MNVIAFIFARGGSKGLPGKNIRLLDGKPLIAWSIEQAFAVKQIKRVIVSTDCEEIADVAREYGAETPFIRPAALAQDDSPEWLSWQHALEYVRQQSGSLPEVMVSVPATAPLRLPLDIENCLESYEKGDADMVVTVTDAHRNPYFNMVKSCEDGLVELVNTPKLSISRRQDSPAVYDMTTVCYVANAQFIMRNNSTFEGRVKAVHVPLERAIDIDTLLDFKIAELLLNQREID